MYIYIYLLIYLLYIHIYIGPTLPSLLKTHVCSDTAFEDSHLAGDAQGCNAGTLMLQER